jgi:hypothetical protein
MSPPREDASAFIMVVSDRDDEDVRGCVASLVETGARVNTVPDVYAATASLSLGPAPKTILLDIRSLDQRELAFPRLVQRLFGGIEIIVPLFRGTAERAAECGKEDLVPTPVTEILQLISPAAPEDEPPGEATWIGSSETAGSVEAAESARLPAPTDTLDATPVDLEQPSVPARTETSPVAQSHLSTDGGPEAGEAEPSMHEAVRERMSATDSPARLPPPARTPPGKSPERQPPPAGPLRQPSMQPGEPALSPEEMDALLTDEPPALDASRTVTDQDEGEALG